MGKCRFKDDWLLSKDGNGHFIKDWATKNNEKHAFCKLYLRLVNISSCGFQGLMQHARSESHVKHSEIKLNPNQMKFKTVSDNTGNITLPASNTVRLYSARNKTTAAELLWTLTCCVSDYPAASCDGTDEIFRAMFDDVPANFSQGRTKFTYFVTWCSAVFSRSSQGH